MTPDAALAYIRSKLADWAELPARIAAQVARAGQLQATAAQQGRPELAAEAASAGGTLTALATIVRATTDKVVTFLRDMAGQGEPVGPVQLTGPYCSDYARKHPELYTCSPASLGAEGGLELAARFQPRPQARGIPRRVAGRRPAPALFQPVPTVFRHPLAVPGPVLRAPAPGVSSHLGGVPLVLGAVALGLAAAMATAYKALDVQKKRLDLVAQGILPASEAGGGSGQTFGGELGKKAGELLPWLAGGLAAWLILPRIVKATRGTTA